MPCTYKIPAIIFSGGKSSRMREDKALLPFGEYSSLSEYQFHKLSTLFEDVYLSAKEDKFAFDAPLIKDRYQESSPLVAIVSLFEILDADEVFILSVDTPFVNKEVIDTLMQYRNQADIIIATSDSGQQPLCGIYKRAVLPIAQRMLKENKHRLGTLFEKVSCHRVYFKEDALFVNLNHPHEYREALKQIKT